MAEGPLQTAAVKARSQEVILGGERILLTPSRAAIWPAADTAILSDLHLGKTDSLAASGVPVPGGLIESQLEAVDELIDIYAVKRLLIVGDLLHARAGLTSQVLRAVGEWRSHHPVQVLLVPGNHDRGIDRVCADWKLTVCDERFCDGPFEFVHDPASQSQARYTFAGHIHPAVNLAAGGDSLRLPCFHLKPGLCILPAFSRFTGGVAVRPDPLDRLFAIASDELIEI